MELPSPAVEWDKQPGLVRPNVCRLPSVPLNSLLPLLPLQRYPHWAVTLQRETEMKDQKGVSGGEGGRSSGLQVASLLPRAAQTQREGLLSHLQSLGTLPLTPQRSPPWVT